MPHSLPSNVIRLHPQIPCLTRADHVRLDLIDLFRELDEDSQRALVAQMARTAARVRRFTPTARLIRGERGPVTWRRGRSELLLIGPASRRWLRHRAYA